MSSPADEGKVLAVEDDVVLVGSLAGCPMGARVDIEGGAAGIALALERKAVKVALVERGSELVRGARATTSGLPFVALRRASPLVARAPAATALLTGVKALDFLMPLSRGHRTLIVGPRGCGKSDILVTTAKAQRSSDVACIFVGVGRTREAAARLRAQVGTDGPTRFVFGHQGDPPAARMIAPAIAIAAAEELRDAGRDVLVCFDGVAAHAAACREVTAAVARTHPQFVSDAGVFSQLASIVDRAGQLERGGSITVLASLDGTVSDGAGFGPLHPAFIFDQLVPMTTPALAHGLRPAIVAPIGLTKYAGGCARPLRWHVPAIRMALARLRELEAIVEGGAGHGLELDRTTREELAAGRRVRALMAQPGTTPVDLTTLVVLALAVSKRVHGRMPIEHAPAFEAALVDEAKRRLEPGELAESRPLADETVRKLEEAARAALTREW